MTLRATEPEAIQKRLKAFFFGPAGVGKTQGAIGFPNPYICDTEKGAENYDKLINSVGGVVFQTSDLDEIIKEVIELATTKHDYLTFVLDGITIPYENEVAKCAKEVGEEYGRQYAEAAKKMKRLMHWLMRLDMNVVITSHSKPVYGDDMKQVGVTFDTWKKMDYMFDLVFSVTRHGSKRRARVIKTRIAEFPDGEAFDFSFDAIAQRYSLKQMTKASKSVEVAKPDQVKKLGTLLQRFNNKTFLDKCLVHADVSCIEDLTPQQVAAMIATIEKENPTHV